MSLVLLWLLAWTPYAIVSLIGISGHGDLLTPTATVIPALFAKLSACINPFVYSLTHPKIKKEVISRLRCINTSIAAMGSMTDSPIVHFKSNNSYSRNRELELNLVLMVTFYSYKSGLSQIKLSGMFSYLTFKICGTSY